MQWLKEESIVKPRPFSSNESQTKRPKLPTFQDPSRFSDKGLLYYLLAHSRQQKIKLSNSSLRFFLYSWNSQSKKINFCFTLVYVRTRALFCYFSRNVRFSLKPRCWATWDSLTPEGRNVSPTTGFSFSIIASENYTCSSALLWRAAHLLESDAANSNACKYRRLWMSLKEKFGELRGDIGASS